MGRAADSLLKVEIQGKRLVISIGIGTLAFASVRGDYFEHLDPDGEKQVKITDEMAWAKGILAALKDEEEDGTTLVHKMFDKAAEDHFENGGEGAAEELEDVK